MSNSNFSANNFDSIDAEFGLTNNNNKEEITMNSVAVSGSATHAFGESCFATPNQQSIDNNMTIDREFGLEEEQQEVYAVYSNSAKAESSVDGIEIEKGLPMESINFNHFKSYGNPNAKTEMTLFYNIEHRLISWKSPISKTASKLAGKLIRVYEAVESGYPEKRVAWTRAYDTTVEQDCLDLIKLLARTIRNENTVASAVKLLQSLAGTMFISQWEVQEENPDNYNTAANEVASRTITANAERVAHSIELNSTNKVDAVYNASHPQDHEALIEILQLSIQNGRTPKGCFKALAQRFSQGIQINGCVDNGKRPWEVVLPTHLLSTQGRFDKSGFSHDNNIQTIYAFLNLLAFGARNKEVANTLADYAYAVGFGLKLWRDDVVEGKGSLTKGAPAFIHHGMKVVANAMAGYEEINGVQVPVIVLDETNPLVVPSKAGSKRSVAIGKDGRNAKLIKDGDVVFFHRNPVIDMTPAIVRISKKQRVCGQFVAAISPDAFAYGTFGDFDGDCIWLVPAKQVGIHNVDADVTSSNVNPKEQIASLMAHPLVGKSIACTTMSVHNGAVDSYSESSINRQILDGICEVTKFDVSDAVADRTELVKMASIELAGNDRELLRKVVAEGLALISYRAMSIKAAEATANHYRIRVGQGYSAMFNAYSEFISEYNGNEQGKFLRKTDLISIKAASFYIYEHIGLSGYSKDNEEMFQKLTKLAEEHLGNRKPKSVGHRRLDMHTVECRVVREQYDLRVAPAARYIAMSLIQSRLERANAAEIPALCSNPLAFTAIQHGLFRSLTKSVINSQGKLSAVLVHASENSSNPYAPVLVAMANGSKTNFGRGFNS